MPLSQPLNFRGPVPPPGSPSSRPQGLIACPPSLPEPARISRTPRAPRNHGRQSSPSSGGDGFIGSDLASDPAVKSSCEVALEPGEAATGAPESCNGVSAGGVVSTYFAGASPAAGGTRHFGTNQAGTIFQAASNVPPTRFGAPVGAVPIR